MVEFVAQNAAEQCHDDIHAASIHARFMYNVTLYNVNFCVTSWLRYTGNYREKTYIYTQSKSLGFSDLCSVCFQFSLVLGTLIALISSSCGILTALTLVAILVIRRKRKRQEKRDSEAQQVVPQYSNVQKVVFLLLLRANREYSSRTGLL